MSTRPRLLSTVAWSAGQIAGVLAILFVMLGGWTRDFRAPLHFSADSLEYLMQAKGTIDHGWWWFHPRLAAPSTFAQLAYPSDTNVDQAIVWVVGRFTRDVGLCLNVTWMLIVACSAWLCTWGLRQTGVSRRTAMAMGVLYAFSPYALYRNIEHFSLATYLVPLACAAALLVATGRVPAMRSRVGLALVAGCVLLGLDYAYYAFFGAFVLLVASLMAAVTGWSGPAWRRGLGLVAVVSLATLINLTPSFVVWAEQGKPLIVPDKTVAESELYGLKVRQLVSPVLDQSFLPLKAWTDREARAKFPLETENSTSRLGLVGTLGFLGLIVVLLVPGPVSRATESGPLVSAAGLTLALVLLGTVGSFGSLFSLLVSPEIRSYNRVYPFIAFFSWFAVGWAIDRLAARPAGRRWSWVTVLGVLVLGVYDESHAAIPLNRSHTAIRDERDSLAAFVGALEEKVAPGAMVFQLPLTTYLNDYGEVRMRPYDEIKPYLMSTRIHWSYPALANAVVRWQHAVARLPTPAMASALDQAGFSAIVVDRNGYEDRGVSVIAELVAESGRSAVLAESDRYVAVDLRLAPKSPTVIAALPAWTDAFDAATTGLPACGLEATANLDSVGPVKVAPTRPVPVVSSGEITLRGWALDHAHRSLAGDVDVVVDGAPVPTFYGVDRPDIATRYGVTAYRFSGFVTKVGAASLTPGPHRVSVRVMAADRRCVTETAPVTVVK